MVILCLQDLPDLVAVKDADFSSVDAVFCCLPHGTTQVFFNLIISFSVPSFILCCSICSKFLILLQEIIKGLPTNLKIVDLSAVHIGNL